MDKRKLQNVLFSVLISIAVLVIVAVILDHIKITPLKVYRDKEYHFTLKYPEYWTMEERPQGGVALVVFAAPRGEEGDKFNESVNITVVDLSREPKLQNLTAFSKETTRQLLGVFGKYFNVFESQMIRMGRHFGPFGGIPAYRFGYITLNKTAATGGKLKYLHVWTLRGRTAFILTFAGDLEDFNANLRHFNRMVKTFKFEK